MSVESARTTLTSPVFVMRSGVAKTVVCGTKSRVQIPPGAGARVAAIMSSADAVTFCTFGGQVELRVSDHGPGVPDDRKEEIFHPFQRMGDTDNTAGIGLGLALTKGFVEGMGGTLTAEDTPAGGLTMVLSLPAAHAAPEGVPE